MALEGFDPKWKDLPDYIIGITKEIWEDRNVHALHHYYDADMDKRSPDGVVHGNVAVINETLASIAMWPDVQAYADDVIWSGDPEGGFLSSHRLTSTFTHVNDGILGPPTGRLLSQMVFADCACRNDAIYDEWLIHDGTAIAHQLGLSAREVALREIAAEGGPSRARFPLTPATDAPARYTGRGNDNPWGTKYAGILGRIMDADLAVIPREYDRACKLHYSGGRQGTGWAVADRHWAGLRAAFPNAAFEVHHVIGREDPMMPPRAAVRWSLTGRHEGFGAFGRPTGAEVHVMGFAHAEFGPWGLRREWALYDDIAIWKQILLQETNPA